MPSFLNKVFGYKKHDDKEAPRPSREASDTTLLDGKYEAISPVVSPSAITFAEAQSSKDAERDVGFSLFRPRPRGLSRGPQRRPDAVPQLTLHLPGPKENLDSRAFGVAFEADPDTQLVLDDAVIGAKRLSPLEALILIRACAQVITERGLETLGIMHPHWFSASPEVQRKLISLFIHSLAPQSRITTLSPTPTASATAFENELHFTRSPRDVAAVLRWGLRHLSLENGHLGKDSAEWAWYNTFFNAERDASYPLGAFSQLLLPQLPTSHVELLVSVLALISSLASHAETNSISGSKLSKFLGLWLIAATRSEASENWDHFYARWERAGRILEHLFLARLREESLAQRLPTRLQELIKCYPYNKGSPATEQDLLSRPRFTTVQHDALLVRVETLLTHNAEQPRQHPIQLIVDALQLPTDTVTENDYVKLWNAIKAAASESDPGSSASEGSQINRIFADDTLQLLSLIPADSSVPTSPILLATPKVVSPRRSSSSLTKIIESAISKPRKSNGSAAASPTSPTTPMITDWAQFSLSGFGETPATQPLSALFDQDDDVEVTRPHISRRSSHKRGSSRTRRRRSEDNDIPATPSTQQLSEPEPIIVETKLASVHIIQIDEAFVDFWSDAIVDPISADWPAFVVCGLKVIANVEKPVRWLVIEQIYTREEPQTPRVPSPDVGARGRSPRPSFRSDISGFRISNMFSSTRKRFSVFSKSQTDLTPRKSTGKSPKVGELGEILAEEEPSTPTATEGSKRVEIAITTPFVANKETTVEPTASVTVVEPSSTTPVPAPADEAPTTIQAPEVKKQLEHEGARKPSADFGSATPQQEQAHGDLSANLGAIKSSEAIVSPIVEVVSQSTSTSVPAEDVDGSVVIVASPLAAGPEKPENGVVLQGTTENLAHFAVEAIATTATAVVINEATPIEDKVPDHIVEEAHVVVESGPLAQSAVVVPVEVPGVEIAEEISESVVLVEATPVSEVVAKTSELVVAAESEPAVEETQVDVQVEECSQEPVAALEPEPVETPAVEVVAQTENLPLAQVHQDVVIVETEVQPALDVSASDAVETPQEFVQEVDVPAPTLEIITVAEETPGQETGGDAGQPAPEPAATVEEVAPAPEQLDEEIPVPVAEEPEVAVTQEPEPVAAVEKVVVALEQPAEETLEETVEESQVIAEEERSQDAAVQPVEEPTVEVVAAEPEPVTVEVQAPVEAEPIHEAVVEEPAVEATPAEIPPPVVAEPEPVEEVQVVDEPSQDAVAQPAEQPSVPEPEASDDIPAATAAVTEEVVEEVIVAEDQPAPEPAVVVEETEVVVEESEPAEVAPVVVSEPEPAAEETLEPPVEDVQVPIQAEEPAPADEPVPEVAPEEVVAIEEVASPEPTVVAVEPTAVTEPEALQDEPAEPITEEEPAPVVAEEIVVPEPVVEASEPIVVAEPEPAEDSAPVPIVEEPTTEEVAVPEPAVITEPEPVEDKAVEPVVEAEPTPVVEEEPAPVVVEEVVVVEAVIDESGPTAVAEPEPTEDKAPEPLVGEQAPVEAVEPPAESAPLVEDDDDDVAAPATEQEVAAEVIEPVTQPEPEVISDEAEAVDEPQGVAQEPEPVPETVVLVEEDAIESTEPPAAEAGASEERPAEPVVEEVESAVEAQESSEEPNPVPEATPSQEPESVTVIEEVFIEQPVEDAEEPPVVSESEQVDAQPQEAEAVPFVEDEDVEEQLVEDQEVLAEPLIPAEVDVPEPELQAPADDATPEEA